MLAKPEFDKNDFMWRLSTAVTVLSGLFTFIVFVLIIVNYLLIRAADPIDNLMLSDMRDEYAAMLEQDEAFAQRIRDLDLITRKAFFTTQEHLRIGGLMLLVGVVIFLVAFKNMGRWKPDVPELAETPMAETEWLSYAQSRQYLTWVCIAILAGGLLASFLTESHVTVDMAALINASTVEAAQENAGEVEGVPAVAKEFPDWDAIQLNWPSFRGPGAYGRAHFTNAPTEWDIETGTAIRWKTEVPLGTNSPVIWGNRLFLSAADDVARTVYCYDTETGELLWERTLETFPGTPDSPPSATEETGFAAPTLAVHGDQVFAVFANADIASYDFEGNFIWGMNLGVPDNHYGHSSSLLAYGALVYVQMDTSDEARLLALNAATGKQVWIAERERISWASPIVAQTPAGAQIILCSEDDVDAYDPESGELLWSQTVLGGEVAPSAAYSDGIVFAANEYAMGAAIRVSGTQGAVESEILWEWDDMLPEVASPIGDGERFYFATSMGELVSLDAQTGEEVWVEELSMAGFYSSPVLVGDRIYVSDMDGTMYIVRASADFELIASQANAEQTFATPAFMDGRIYLRTAEHLYCIENDA